MNHASRRSFLKSLGAAGAAAYLLKAPWVFAEELVATPSQTEGPYYPVQLTLYTMFVLAYCTGLRLGELVRLKLKDVDLSASAIEIRGTKFFKSRRLPISVSAMAALREYLDGRRKSGAPLDPEAPVFIHEHVRIQYCHGREACTRCDSPGRHK